MSQLLVFKSAAGSWVMAADRRFSSSDLLTEPGTKIFSLNGFTCGIIGSGREGYAFRRAAATTGLDLFDADAVRSWYAEAVRRERIEAEKGLESSGRTDSLNLGLIAVRGEEAVVINQVGAVWNIDEWEALGPGSQLGQYLFRTRLADLRAGSPEEVAAILRWMIGEISTVEASVGPDADAVICP